MPFSAKILPSNRFSLETQGSTPPHHVWEILDPPLAMQLISDNIKSPCCRLMWKKSASVVCKCDMFSCVQWGHFEWDLYPFWRHPWPYVVMPCHHIAVWTNLNGYYLVVDPEMFLLILFTVKREELFLRLKEVSGSRKQVWVICKLLWESVCWGGGWDECYEQKFTRIGVDLYIMLPLVHLGGRTPPVSPIFFIFM